LQTWQSDIARQQNLMTYLRIFLLEDSLVNLQLNARLANTQLKDGESAQDSHVIACNFAKYLPI